MYVAKTTSLQVQARVSVLLRYTASRPTQKNPVYSTWEK